VKLTSFKHGEKILSHLALRQLTLGGYWIQELNKKLRSEPLITSPSVVIPRTTVRALYDLGKGSSSSTVATDRECPPFWYNLSASEIALKLRARDITCRSMSIKDWSVTSVAGS
jgi:hypothetical protein